MENSEEKKKSKNKFPWRERVKKGGVWTEKKGGEHVEEQEETNENKASEAEKEKETGDGFR